MRNDKSILRGSAPARNTRGVVILTSVLLRAVCGGECPLPVAVIYCTSVTLSRILCRHLCSISIFFRCFSSESVCANQLRHRRSEPSRFAQHHVVTVQFPEK